MRRKMFIFLVVLGVLTLGVRFFVNQGVSRGNPPGVEMRFVEYNPTTPLTPLTPPLANPPLAQLQNSVDSVSEAAMKQHWTTASRAVQQLEETWQRLRSGETNQLEIEKDIANAIQALHYNVWGKDQQGALSTAQKLTNLISQLSS